jgi:hypothetical protein
LNPVKLSIHRDNENVLFNDVFIAKMTFKLTFKRKEQKKIFFLGKNKRKK